MTVMRVKYINGVRIVRCPDGLWRDDKGTIIALAEDENSKDKKVRCGVGKFSLREDDECSDAARAHDFAYTSPAYQQFHTRKEADDKLETDLKIVATSRLRRLLAPVLARIARLLGGRFWENDRTR